MSAYKGFTEAQAKAHKKYMAGVATIQLRTTADMRESIKDRAAALGCPSVNAYILGLVEADLAGATTAGGVLLDSSNPGVTRTHFSGSQKDS